MITGFNTDINYDGVTYHVQTEDKGLRTPFILSLVYQGGTILASKRSPYEDLVASFDEKVLEVRLNRQHNLICAAIRAGRVEDLKKMTKKAAAEKRNNSVVANEVKKEANEEQATPQINQEPPQIISKQKQDAHPVATPIVPQPIGKKPINENDLIIVPPIEAKAKVRIRPKQTELEIPIPKPRSLEKSEIKEVQPPVIEKFEVTTNKSAAINNEKPQVLKPSFETSKPLVQRKVKKKLQKKPTPVISKTLPQPPALEKVIKEETTTDEEVVWDIPVTVIEEENIEATREVEETILPSDAVEIVGDLEQFDSLLEDELKVKILGGNVFNSGGRKNVNVLVCRGEDDKTVENANVMVKVIGSDFRPMIFHAKADSNGVATVFLKLPTFRSGRAAVLIRAMVDGEEAELRRAIIPE